MVNQIQYVDHALKSTFRTLTYIDIEVTQSCLTLCDPMDCSLPGFSVHGIFQARVLEWGAIAFSNNIYLYLNQIKAECQRIDAFELWYWRRLCRVPRTAR